MNWFREFMDRTEDTLKIVVFYSILFFVIGLASGYLTFK